MRLYLDSSVYLKHYLDEPDSQRFIDMVAPHEFVTARVTWVEVRRCLARDLRGRALVEAREQFSRDWDGSEAVDLDASLCDLAAELAERTGVRSLDALHLAAVQRAGPDLPLVTADARQARAARSLGWTVLGV